MGMGVILLRAFLSRDVSSLFYGGGDSCVYLRVLVLARMRLLAMFR